jgi:hypothetical protein
VIISPLNTTWSFIWTNLYFLYPRIIWINFDWIWLASSGEDDLNKIFSVFLLFCYYLPLERDIPLHLNKLESHPQRWFVPSLIKIGPVVLEKMILKDPIPFLHFCDYLPFEEDLVLYFNKRESPLSRDTLYQVWLNLASWFWRRFLKMFSVFLLFCYYLPIGEGQSPFNPLTQGQFVSSLIKIGPVVLEKNIFKWPTPFLHFCDYLPFEEDLALWPFIWRNLNFLYPRIICTKFDWIWLAGSEKKI